ncbi:iron ABC transporter permease [Rothia nasimurium]|uniref:Iron ABC transporter permease n=1 Tax=Rothia nasimurium TaxID=85336 RepID=A0A4Y9F306_9MICC|nr:iron ABC transporter permease [Rothia nasimurium]MBF0808414.1 iron ABC transporter permease [Rothia nasimurium]TFU22119.1 iron ABC transporter permease [Rothia nasimurium]
MTTSPVRSPLREKALVSQRYLVLTVCAILLGLSLMLSLRFGSNSLESQDIWAALSGDSSSPAYTIVWEQRIPRTLLALVCGAALAVAGSLMQTLTRNPLADPGLLGVNAGASLAVVLAVVLLGPLPIVTLMGAAFIGALVSVGAVFTLGGAKGQSMSRFILAGVALAASLTAITQALLLANQTAYNEFRFWAAGSLEGRGYGVLLPTAVLVGLSLILGFCLIPALRTLALGAETALALGTSVQKIYALTLLTVSLLAAAATAAIGPIAFVGLAVPFILRSLLGNRVGWVTVGSLLAGPAWLIASDILARTIMAPAEIQVGIITTLLGGPLFLALMSRRKVREL